MKVKIMIVAVLLCLGFALQPAYGRSPKVGGLNVMSWSSPGEELPKGRTWGRGMVPLPGSKFTFCVQIIRDPEEVIFDFGDGRTGRPYEVRHGDNYWAKHTYTKPGEYTVTVIARNKDGEDRSTNRVKIWPAISSRKKDEALKRTPGAANRTARDMRDFSPRVVPPASSIRVVERLRGAVEIFAASERDYLARGVANRKRRFSPDDGYVAVCFDVSPRALGYRYGIVVSSLDHEPRRFWANDRYRIWATRYRIPIPIEDFLYCAGEGRYRIKVMVAGREIAFCKVRIAAKAEEPSRPSVGRRREVKPRYTPAAGKPLYQTTFVSEKGIILEPYTDLPGTDIGMYVSHDYGAHYDYFYVELVRGTGRNKEREKFKVRLPIEWHRPPYTKTLKRTEIRQKWGYRFVFRFDKRRHFMKDAATAGHEVHGEFRVYPTH